MTKRSAGASEGVVGLQREQRWIVASILALSILICVGCGRDPSGVMRAGSPDIGSTREAASTLTTISVDPPLAAIPATVTAQFSATAIYSNNKKKKLTPTWSVSNPTVASVSATGLVTALKSGSVNVIATDTVSGISGSAALTVTPASLTSIAVTPGKKNIAVDAVVTLKATGTFSDGTTFRLTGSNVIWASSNAAITTVDPTGSTTGVGAGTAAITATDSVTGISGKSFVTVGTATLSSVDVTPASASFPAGLTQPFVATGTYTDGSTLDLTSIANWSSADSTIATVDSLGNVTAVAPGSTKITAGVKGKKGTAKLAVTTATLASIAITPPNKTIPKGTTLQLTAIATYSDHTTQDVSAFVTWTSSSTALFVSNDPSSAGLATALGVGVATVTATDPNTGVTATTTVNVSSAALQSLQIGGATSVAKGLSAQYTATGIFTDSTTRDMTASVTWTSSSTDVATISNDSASAGLATTAAPGATTIGATDPTSGVAAPGLLLTVTPAVLTSLSINPQNAKIPDGLLVRFSATGIFSDGSQTSMTTAVTWSAFNGTATISNVPGANGQAFTNGLGDTTIQAVDPISGLAAQTTLTGTAALVQSVGVTPTGAHVIAGGTVQFTATGVLTDKTKQDLTNVVNWSADTRFATISNAPGSKGLATGVAPGFAGVFASYPGASGGQGGLTVTAAVLTSIAITPPSPSLPAGLTQQLVATGIYSDHSTQDLTSTITWDTDDDTVATVSNASGSNGVLSAVAPGTTTIKAIDPVTGIRGTTPVAVTAAVLRSLAISPPAISIPAGTNVSLQATGTYSDGSTNDLTTAVTWSATGSAITVSNAPFNNGLLNAIAPGTGTVTALEPVSGLIATVGVTVTQAALQSIAVNPRSVSSAKGTTVQFTATGKYTDGSTQDLTSRVTWSSSGPSATISNADGSNGLVTAAATGNANISAFDPATGLRGAASMVITAATLTSIQITPPSPSVVFGGTTQLFASGLYTDGTTADLTGAVTWTSSGAAVNVSNAAGSAGLATGVQPGTASITATDPSSGIAASATVTVGVVQGGTAISAGYYHTCSIRADQGIDCWGFNDEGTLGIGASIDNSVIAVKVSTLSNVSSLGMGAYHSCALLGNGTVDCWGQNRDGEVGDGTLIDRSVPTPVTGLSGVVSIASAGVNSCALLGSGSVECWGNNGVGQLGNGTTVSSTTPVPVTNLSGVTAIAAGDSFHCALLSNGTVECWGYNQRGQLGNGTTTNASLPGVVSGVTGAVAVAAGGLHSCAVLSTGGVQCWGANDFGELGNGTTQATLVPVPVTGVTNATSVVVGYDHTCAVLSTGAVSCWGYNGNGQLGNATFTDSPTPVAVRGLTSAVTALTAGAYHNCALQANGARVCWGYDFDGELGDGYQSDESVPGPTAAPVALAGGFVSTCALLSNGRVDCWGDNGYGTLGNGTTDQSNVATPVVNLGSVRAITANSYSPCALVGPAGTGVAMCWGYNGDGELGNGSLTNSSTPQVVRLPNVPSTIASGGQHTCASTTNGQTYCWGSNQFGQLGSNAPSPTSTPASVPVPAFATSVTAGANHTCALTQAGTVYCWGYNALGQLGFGASGSPSSTPHQVVNLSGVTAISAGVAHTCALLPNGTVQCWGQNTNGELGIGSTVTGWPQPAPVINLTGVTAISASGYHTCAKLSNGNVACWGDNHFGELGDGTTNNSLVPLLLPNATNVSAVGAGGNQSCVVIGASVECLGWNANGELGNGTTTSSTSLTTVLW